jgi:hypothetical protein
LKAVGMDPERSRLILVLLAVNLFILPSLTFGYMEIDDFQLIQSSLAARDQGVFWRFVYARPVWILSYPLVSALSDTALAHRLAALLLVNGIVFFAYRLIGHYKAWPLVVLAIVFHPAFLFPISWIAQRSDLLLILFATLTFTHISRRRGILFLALSDLAKSPFVFHNLFYAFKAWKNRAPDSKFSQVAIFLSIAMMCGALFGMYHSYYSINIEAAEPVGLYNVTDRDFTALAFILVSRGFKIAEGLFLAFVPLPAFYQTVALPFAIPAYLVVWGTLAYSAWRTGVDNRCRSVQLLVMAALMAIPLALGTGLRVIPPTLFFLFIGLLTLVRPSRMCVAALSTLVALNLLGSVLNYRFSDTGCYDLANSNPGWDCRHRDVPIYSFGADRQQLVDQFVKWWIQGRS